MNRGSNIDVNGEIFGIIGINLNSVSGGVFCVVFSCKDYGVDVVDELVLIMCVMNSVNLN